MENHNWHVVPKIIYSVYQSWIMVS